MRSCSARAAARPTTWPSRASTGSRLAQNPARQRIVFSSIEHHALLDPVTWLTQHEGAEVGALTAAIDLPRGEVDSGGDGGRLRRANVRARADSDSFGDVDAWITDASAVLESEGLTDIEVTADGGLDLTGRAPDADFNGPSATIRRSGAMIVIDVVSRCESGD